jgi:hypothetical protein
VVAKNVYLKCFKILARGHVLEPLIFEEYEFTCREIIAKVMLMQIKNQKKERWRFVHKYEP